MEKGSGLDEVWRCGEAVDWKAVARAHEAIDRMNGSVGLRWLAPAAVGGLGAMVCIGLAIPAATGHPFGDFSQAGSAAASLCALLTGAIPAAALIVASMAYKESLAQLNAQRSAWRRALDAAGADDRAYGEELSKLQAADSENRLWSKSEGIGAASKTSFFGALCMRAIQRRSVAKSKPLAEEERKRRSQMALRFFPESFAKAEGLELSSDSTAKDPAPAPSRSRRL